MSESAEKETSSASRPEEIPEDERRARAAEINRKRTEEEWNRNKKSWLKANFPETTQGG
jgi:hypothetical protein